METIMLPRLDVEPVVAPRSGPTDRRRHSFRHFCRPARHQDIRVCPVAQAHASPGLGEMRL